MTVWERERIRATASVSELILAEREDRVQFLRDGEIEDGAERVLPPRLPDLRDAPPLEAAMLGPQGPLPHRQASALGQRRLGA